MAAFLGPYIVYYIANGNELSLDCFDGNTYRSCNFSPCNMRFLAN